MLFLFYDMSFFSAAVSFFQDGTNSKPWKQNKSFKCLLKFSFAALPFDTCRSSWRAAIYMALTWSFCFLTSFLLPLPHICRYCDFLLCGHKFLSDNHNYFTDGLAQMASRQKMVNCFPSMTERTTSCLIFSRKRCQTAGFEDLCVNLSVLSCCVISSAVN